MPRQKMIRDPQTGMLTPATELRRQDSINQNSTVDMAVAVPMSKKDVVEGYKEALANSGQPLDANDEVTDKELLQEAMDNGFTSKSGNLAINELSDLEHDLLDLPSEKYGITLAGRGHISHVRDRNIQFPLDNSGSMQGTSGLKKALLSGPSRVYLPADSEKVRGSSGFYCPADEISNAQEAVIASKQYLEVALCYNNTSKTRYLNLITFSANLKFTIPVYKNAQDKANFQMSVFYKIDEIDFNRGTPLLKTLKANIPTEPTLTIIFTDGADPNAGMPVKHSINGKIVECSQELVTHFVSKPDFEVVTIRKCTNGPEADWAEVPDAKAKNLDTMDDDKAEGLEIEDMQGPGFFKTVGLLITKALCPNIPAYDNLDQKTLNAPELSLIYGRDIAPKSKEFIRFLVQAIIHRLELPATRTEDGETKKVLAKIDDNTAKNLIEEQGLTINDIRTGLTVGGLEYQFATPIEKNQLANHLQKIENVLNSINTFNDFGNMNIGGNPQPPYNQGSPYPNSIQYGTGTSSYGNNLNPTTPTSHYGRVIPPSNQQQGNPYPNDNMNRSNSTRKRYLFKNLF